MSYTVVLVLNHVAVKMTGNRSLHLVAQSEPEFTVFWILIHVINYLMKHVTSKVPRSRTVLL